VAKLAMYAGAVLVLTLAEYRVYEFISARGVRITGDEPHYLILARALTHFTPHVTAAYQADFRTHYFYPWPPLATIHTPGLAHIFPGPHGLVSEHGLGVAMILAPFLAVGGKTLALCGLFAFEAAGFAYLHWRASSTLSLSTGSRAVFALAMAGPAVWLAATQIYPDLPAGILLAIVVVEVVVVERTGSLRLPAALLTGAAVAFVPWLHIKNLIPAVVVAAALTWVAWRAGSGSRLVLPGVIVGVSWALLLAYDVYYFGHLLGYPQPGPTLTRASLAVSVGLLFDRHQGLLVQVPAAVMGLIGLWRARRSTPLAAAATAAVALFVIVLNGTYTSVPYGGGALAGRFQWTVLPLLLIWIPFLLTAVEASPARLWGLGAVVAGLGLWEAVPILRDSHVYYNAQYPYPPWDPALYPGWWSRLDSLMGRFYADGRMFGAPWWALPVELVLLVAGCLALARMTRPRPLGRTDLVAGALVLVVAGLVATTVPQSLPNRPLSFTGADLGGPVVSYGTGAAESPAVALQIVGAGGFRARILYVLTGPDGSATFTLSCPDQPTPAGETNQVTEPLVPGSRTASAGLRCPHGKIWYESTASNGASLVVRSLTLSKVAT
jgi:hypothetical protein